MAELLSLRGRTALSPFRVSKLLQGLSAASPAHQIRASRPRSGTLSRSRVHYPSDERNKLERLLTYGRKSTDAADIGDAARCRAAAGHDLAMVIEGDRHRAAAADSTRSSRIERGIAFHVATVATAPLYAPADRAALLPLIHDRMTEAVLRRLDDARRLFAHFPPQPLATIPLLAQRSRGASIARTPRSASRLREDEIDYLDASFRRIGRDPTDVELMMFAQANSEHCRHKIFNADWIDRRRARSDKSLFAMIRARMRRSPQRNASSRTPTMPR